MKLTLTGHSYKYAVEQIMLALFPGEKPTYSQNDDMQITAESRMTYGSTYAQTATIIENGGVKFRGVARVSRGRLTDKLVTDRLLQRIVKQSFFRAAAGLLPAPPEWGSLTGIRPAKIIEGDLSSGCSVKSAVKKLVGDYYVSPERALLCVDAAQTALAVGKTIEPRDIALYIGIPFCPTRCAYCSFVSNSAEKSFALVEPFIETLLDEIRTASDTVRELGLRVVSIYIGGGTPTSLPDDSLEAVMRAVSDMFDVSFVREYTVEAGRPDTITPEKLRIISNMGAGRVCVNPQSMSADVLQAIGRKHTPGDVMDAVSNVKRFGLALNMDIIAGLPEDDREGFSSTLDAVLDLEPGNVTVHTLSLKKGSRIMLESTDIPGGAEVAAMLAFALKRLRGSGYVPYYLYRQKFTSGGFENTGWSLPGCECLYNVCMMEDLCTVISLGGGGVTKIVAHGGRIERIFNAKYPREYIARTEKIDAKFNLIKEMYRRG